MSVVIATRYNAMQTKIASVLGTVRDKGCTIVTYTGDKVQIHLQALSRYKQVYIAPTGPTNIVQQSVGDIVKENDATFQKVGYNLKLKQQWQNNRLNNSWKLYCPRQTYNTENKCMGRIRYNPNAVQFDQQILKETIPTQVVK